ncbi:hypothetical protein BDV93DRAFT_546672 [Ceratobasidium sp. AG-I]|nr:hypothetical protein BDV93DRAFT_546672 [Ceratobasidium sp. AG-I]
MASHPPGGQQDTFRHRITNVKLDPPTSDYDISLKILVDGHEMHRLPPIKRGTPLSWDKMIPCDVHSSSLLELRVYEKHFFNLKRVGSIEYAVSTVVDQLEASFELSTKQFTVTLSFSSPDATSPQAKQAPLAALAEAQEKEKKTRLLERLGPTRDALKAILDFGQAVSDLHPAAKIAFETRKSGAM